MGDVEGISKIQAENFSKNEINTISDFLKADDKTLLLTKGIGQKSLEKINNLIKYRK